MSDVRYQVFLSSTFRDLQAERQGALDAILELGHFPAGMEIFPAADATPWALIEQVIAESDYYILIVGGTYGSTDESRISYTEREYDLAVALHKPILAFLHAEPDSISVAKSDRTPAAKRKLVAFRKKVQKHHCKHWTSAEQLKYQITAGLSAAFRGNPQKGWLRGGGPDVTDLLTRLAVLQQEHDALRADYDRLRGKFGAPVANDLATGNEVLDVEFRLVGEDSPRKLGVSWNELFSCLGDELISPSDEPHLRRVIGSALADRLHASDEFRQMRPDWTKMSALQLSAMLAPERTTVKAILLQFAA